MPLRCTVIVMLAAAMLVVAHAATAAEPDADGDALHAARCAGCHGKRGALNILRRTPAEERARMLQGSHLRNVLPDEAARAAVAAYLERLLNE